MKGPSTDLLSARLNTSSIGARASAELRSLT
eukprot:CAMPEP_0172168160 /NCGR_PEP_ID=MMETSP1050-20130122/9979_1 /TAXON_ID=233186 /ORGANISM="Cryptomonas curvata, Strain CCAP979/52" /LENGTH=30 /DNA_ID= /DNA_START= /DNA_END= /DNA_ORIENTATION=